MRILIALAMAAALYPFPVLAEEGWFPNHPRIYGGITHNLRTTVAPECNRSDWVGEFGAEHDIYQNGRLRVEGAYRHNSCLDEFHDRAVMDGIGVRFIWTIR